MCLETFNNIYKALDQMRCGSVLPDTETNEEMRQRVTEECKWFVHQLFSQTLIFLSFDQIICT